ncbi:MAG: Ni/Fe-hydrogenase cytochrome b subunit [Acidimicrobiia bacterium]|nr:Ni/Fe-hydrogenase cytochrome b subunit [Acidimicrobiia bacterium]
MNPGQLFRRLIWRLLALAILAGGAYAAFVRFTQGLGAATNLSDTYPWGIWIGFDVLCGVGLAAGGFAITSAVYILHIEQLRPVVRPAVLTAFLGYVLVVVALMLDLGKPWNIWRPVVMWNPRSVMFEVAWCVMLYTAVLALEFSPNVFNRLGWQRAEKAVKSLVVPLVGLGFLLSTLHQSSLGSLYLILPTKLHALWYSPLLPALFFLSAIATGLGMVIFESSMSARAFGRALEGHLLAKIAKAQGLFLGLYLFLRFWDLGWRGSLPPAFVLSGAGAMEAAMFWVENGLFLLALGLVLAPQVRQNSQYRFWASVTVIGGFLMNRLNVSLTGLEAAAGVRYVPSWMEVSVTASIVVLGIALFALAAKHLPIFPPETPHALPSAAPQPVEAGHHA